MPDDILPNTTMEKTLWVLLYEQSEGPDMLYLQFFYALDEAEARRITTDVCREQEGKRRVVSLKMYPDGFVIVRRRLPGKVPIEPTSACSAEVDPNQL